MFQGRGDKNAPLNLIQTKYASPDLALMLFGLRSPSTTKVEGEEKGKQEDEERGEEKEDSN